MSGLGVGIRLGSETEFAGPLQAPCHRACKEWDGEAGPWLFCERVLPVPCNESLRCRCNAGARAAGEMGKESISVSRPEV